MELHIKYSKIWYFHLNTQGYHNKSKHSVPEHYSGVYGTFGIALKKNLYKRLKTYLDNL